MENLMLVVAWVRAAFHDGIRRNMEFRLVVDLDVVPVNTDPEIVALDDAVKGIISAEFPGSEPEFLSIENNRNAYWLEENLPYLRDTSVAGISW